MGLRRSPEEKAAAQERRAEARFARSPVGLARAAQSRGDALFQVALPVDDESASILSEIEHLGWQLEHAGYTSKITSYSSNTSEGVLSSLSIDGELTGIYLFRRPVSGTEEL